MLCIQSETAIREVTYDVVKEMADEIAIFRPMLAQ
jgi:hypothetical protein